MNKFEYFNNPAIIAAINTHMKHIANAEDRNDCRQEIYSNLYDFMPFDTYDAMKLVDSTAMKFRRNYIDPHKGEYEIPKYDDIELGNGGHQTKARFNSSETMQESSFGVFNGLNINTPFEHYENRIESDDFGPHKRL